LPQNLQVFFDLGEDSDALTIPVKPTKVLSLERDCDSHIPALGMTGGLHGPKDEDLKPRWPSVRIRSMLLVAKPVVITIQ
jgi:hypothetical protein